MAGVRLNTLYIGTVLGKKVNYTSGEKSFFVASSRRFFKIKASPSFLAPQQMFGGWSGRVITIMIGLNHLPTHA